MALTTEIWIPALFQAWAADGISYVVLRNYESLPREIGNDLDVLVSPDRRKEAVDRLCSCIQSLGGVMHHRASFSCDSVFFHGPESTQQFHVDVFSRVTWRFFPLLNAQPALRNSRTYNGFKVLSEPDEALLNLFNHLLHGAEIREKYQSLIQAQAVNDIFFQGLEKLLGRSFAEETVALIQSGDWKGIERKRSRYRLMISLRSWLRSPLHVIKLWILDSTRLVKRFLSSPGLFAVMVGPDGSGKSTAGLSLQKGLSGTFYPSRCRYFHWKARLIKQDTVPTGPPKSDPHGNTLRSKGESILFFLAHVAEGMVAHWFKIKPVLFKNGLVLIDRYYYDYFVDPRRYRLQLSQKLVGVVYKFVPKPDLIFFFDAPAEVLQSRKKEVTFEECARQRAAYLALAKTLPQAVVVDACKPADEVAQDVLQAALNHLGKRAGFPADGVMRGVAE